MGQRWRRAAWVGRNMDTLLAMLLRALGLSHTRHLSQVLCDLRQLTLSLNYRFCL